MTSEKERFELLLEHIESQNQLMLEGLANVNERQDRFEKMVNKRFDDQERFYGTVLKQMGKDIKDIKTEMKVVKGDIKTMKGDIVDLKKDVKVIKKDITVMKGDMKDIKKGQTVHENRITRLEHKTA